jgi:hypothetical protein
MRRQNEWYCQKRRELVKQFGGRCRYCEIKEGSVRYSARKKDLVDIVLEFAHKANKRISGMNRGRNARVAEVIRNPGDFLLLCRRCHNRYDHDHPLTDEEIKAMNEEVPF